MIQAYSCRPVGAEWHLVVFAATARRARLLGFRSDLESDSDLIQWIVCRLPKADGLCASEAVWTHAGDAPEDVQAKAATLWLEAD